MLAVGDEGFRDMFSDSAACADDGNVLDAVFEAGWLLMCVLLSHDMFLQDTREYLHREANDEELITTAGLKDLARNEIGNPWQLLSVQ